MRTPISCCSKQLTNYNQSFDHVIKGFSRNRIGHQYVEQGDYEIIQPGNDKVITHSNLCRVKEGETVEMSIIFQSFKQDPATCPRCSFVNTHASSEIGWIKWYEMFSLIVFIIMRSICSLHCSCLFHASTVLLPEIGIDTQIPSENPKNRHGRPKARARKDVMRDAFGKNMESHINIFRRISLEITCPLLVEQTDAETYLDVKVKFSDHPDVYNNLRNIMRELKKKQCVPTLDLFLDTGPLCAERTSLA